MKKALTSLSIFAGSVMTAFAQININTTGVATTGRVNDSAIVGLIKSASNIVGMLVPLFVSLAVAAFFWFLVQFIWKGKDDPKVHESGIKGMGYSILAIFVMVSIWGLIGLLGNISGVGQGGSAPIPVVPVLQ
jgi:hypothetical protein